MVIVKMAIIAYDCDGQGWPNSIFEGFLYKYLKITGKLRNPYFSKIAENYPKITKNVWKLREISFREWETFPLEFVCRSRFHWEVRCCASLQSFFGGSSAWWYSGLYHPHHFTGVGDRRVHRLMSDIAVGPTPEVWFQLDHRCFSILYVLK